LIQTPETHFAFGIAHTKLKRFKTTKTSPEDSLKIFEYFPASKNENPMQKDKLMHRRDMYPQQMRLESG
jgi:hypothetical protein